MASRAQAAHERVREARGDQRADEAGTETPAERRIGRREALGDVWFGATRVHLLAENLGDYADPAVVPPQHDGAPRSAELRRLIASEPELELMICHVYIQDFVCFDYPLPARCAHALRSQPATRLPAGPFMTDLRS